MKLPMVNSRGPSITVIGAISEERGLIHHHMIYESKNTENFENFLLGLKTKCEGKRVIIVLDNLRIHYANKLNPIYTNDFKLMFLPLYSSPLNPIERPWSVLKRKWS